MCGISGIVTYSLLSSDSLLKMNQIISHRGPDDEGFAIFNDSTSIVFGSDDTAKESWNSTEDYSPKFKLENLNYKAQVAFGHRRLSIIDLSPKGHQPMCYDNQRYWITYNGEIFNFVELKEELIKIGYSFQTESDTEVILASYKEWGVDCLEKFNGMWSFAIYDSKNQQLFLSRDRFGIKPFYYWFDPKGDFYFASEIKQFTVLPGWKAILNNERALDYLYYSLTDHTEETLFRNVYNLPPGSFFLGTIGELLQSNVILKHKKWYKPLITTFEGEFEEAKKGFLDRFKDAVKLHLRADVSVGSALSGGLDSSSIVSYVNILLKDQNKENLQKTFSSCSLEELYDERSWVEEVIKKTEVEAHYIYPKAEDIFNLTDKILWHMDEPYQSQSAFLGYHVFQEAKRNNVLVLLNGQGADEYLSGYNEFRILRQKLLLKSLQLIKLFKELKSANNTFSLIKYALIDYIPRKFKYSFSFLSQYQKNINKLINVNILRRKNIHPYIDLNFNNSNHYHISNHQLFSEPLQKYLRWEDRNSMAHSIEARVPFLDYRLVEFAQSLPLDFLDGPNMSKKILVESMNGILPESVRNRKDKKGFITPEEKWFKDEYYHEFVKLLEDNAHYSKGIINIEQVKRHFKQVRNGEVKFSANFWRIILFCIWMKVFNVDIED